MVEYKTIFVSEETKKKLEELKENYKAVSLDAVIQMLMVGK